MKMDGMKSKNKGKVMDYTELKKNRIYKVKSRTSNYFETYSKYKGLTFDGYYMTFMDIENTDKRMKKPMGYWMLSLECKDDITISELSEKDKRKLNL